MNKIRRKTIQSIVNQISALQDEMEEILSNIDSVKDEEQEYLDNIPENLQGSERYEMAETAVENLEAAYDAFEELKNTLEDVTSYLDEASA